MASVNIQISDQCDYHCRFGWTAKQALNEIRSSRLLAGGEIEQDGTAISADDAIIAGNNYQLVNFQQQQLHGMLSSIQMHSLVFLIKTVYLSVSFSLSLGSWCRLGLPHSSRSTVR